MSRAWCFVIAVAWLLMTVGAVFSKADIWPTLVMANIWAAAGLSRGNE